MITNCLNSKNFGVPQNRERVFVVGHLRGRSTAEVFPVEGADGANSVCGIGHRNGYHRNLQVFDRGCSDGDTTLRERCQRTFDHKSADDVSCIFAIDKGIRSKERTEANCVTAREDRGLSRHEQEGTLMSQDMEPIGGCYCNMSNSQRRGILGGVYRTLKAQNDSCVVFELTEAIGTVAAFNSEKFSTKIMGGVSRTLKAEKHDTSVVLKVAVREATKQGYAIARGGEIPSTSRNREAKQEEDELG